MPDARRPVRAHGWLTSLVLLGCLCALPAGAQPIELPDIGDSASALISPDEEKRIGRAMMRQLRLSHRLVEDPALTSYVQELGERLIAQSGLSGGYTFFIVDDPSINAFAMFGGYIGVHKGLILATRSEDELAAVLAHEITHVTQHHLVRGLDKAGNMNLPLTVAIITAIMLGGQDPQAAQAVLAASTAGSIQARLDFTREHEREADRLGIQMLAEAGFDADAMPSFFQRLQQEQRFYANIPEFLSTHPVTEGRIADAANRAAQFAKGSREKQPAQRYLLVKAKLRATENSDSHKLLKTLDDEIARTQGEERELARFSRALVLRDSGDHEHARKELEELLGRSPGRIAYIEALALTERQADRYHRALSLLREAVALYPDNASLLLAYAETLIMDRQSEEAARLLRDYTRSPAALPAGFRLLARAETELGRSVAAHIAMSDFYYAVDELHGAIEQLELAKAVDRLDFYHASRIDARLRQLRDEAALLDEQRIR